MILKELVVRNFRNLEAVDLYFDDKLNVFTGQNAQGKTNLLEAIYLLSGSRSFRGGSDADLICFDFPGFFLSGEFEQEEKSNLRLACFWEGTQLRKKAVRDGKAFRSSRALLGVVPMTVFSPDDLDLIKAGPAGRRDYCDVLLSALFPSYAATLNRYQRIVSQKNRLLRDGHVGEVDIFNIQQARFGASVTQSRRLLLERLLPFARQSFYEMAGQIEQLDIRYHSTVTEHFSDEKQLFSAFLKKLSENHQKEALAGASLYGPHRDDLEITVNGKPARAFASQGQQRSAVLALLLARTALLHRHTGRAPLVLLDDVMSELDERRQQYLLEHIDAFQVFITCCQDSFGLHGRGSRFVVKNGQVFPA